MTHAEAQSLGHQASSEWNLRDAAWQATQLANHLNYKVITTIPSVPPHSPSFPASAFPTHGYVRARLLSAQVSIVVEIAGNQQTLTLSAIHLVFAIM